MLAACTHADMLLPVQETDTEQDSNEFAQITHACHNGHGALALLLPEAWVQYLPVGYKVYQLGHNAYDSLLETA